jgi:hypothetical protein
MVVYRAHFCRVGACDTDSGWHPFAPRWALRCICVALAFGTAIGAGLIAPAGANACGAIKRAHAVSHAHGHARAPLVIGDSTMIFAAPVLGHLGLEADARGCRQFGQGVGILVARRHAHTLPPVAVLALGANGPIRGGQIGAALHVIGRRRVLGLVTPRNSASSAGQMRRAARRHPDQVLLIDWVAFSAGHGAWFAGDGLHVNGAGASSFARLITRSVAPFAFPPVRSLHLPDRAAASKRCGVIHRVGHPTRVYVIRGRRRVTCRRARALVRRPRLRRIVNWRTYDWRRTGAGPWAWVYERRDGKAVVATIAGR